MKWKECSVSLKYKNLIPTFLLFLFCLSRHTKLEFGMGESLELPWWLSSKESACKAGDNAGFVPWVEKIPWSRMSTHSTTLARKSSMDRGPWWVTVLGVAVRQGLETKHVSMEPGKKHGNTWMPFSQPNCDLILKKQPSFKLWSLLNTLISFPKGKSLRFLRLKQRTGWCPAFSLTR